MFRLSFAGIFLLTASAGLPVQADVPIGEAQPGDRPAPGSDEAELWYAMERAELARRREIRQLAHELRPFDADLDRLREERRAEAHGKERHGPVADHGSGEPWPQPWPDELHPVRRQDRDARHDREGIARVF